MKKIIVGITGASGSIYGKTIIQELVNLGHEVHLVVTKQGALVLEHEIEPLSDMLKEILLNNSAHQIIVHDNQNLFSDIASGSFKTDGMIIAPCSMGTLGKIAFGMSDHLLTRAADVMIKEKRPLILVTRETPLSPIHLENMLKLSRLGVTIFPPVPAFYNKPTTLDALVSDTVGRILETIDIKNRFHKIWSEPLE
ncbi:MAG: UbiX family flavin prenyltransferase [Vallitaleaceae bacterium]|jgi:4-hydroxy-3-polyprenylbenzoate decarboxylase|nr:UbiX family flavin prenyltransferase [Vallitaleaceae bacterium]